MNYVIPTNLQISWEEKNQNNTNTQFPKQHKNHITFIYMAQMVSVKQF